MLTEKVDNGKIVIKQGDIWMVELSGGTGSEQAGIRPCLIVQNNVGNKFSPTVIICPITKQGKKFNLTHVSINCLSVPSIALCEQIRVIDKTRLISHITTIDSECMIEINKKLKVALGMEEI